MALFLPFYSATVLNGPRPLPFRWSHRLYCRQKGGVPFPGLAPKIPHTCFSVCTVNKKQSIAVLSHGDLGIFVTAVSLPWLIQPLFHTTGSEIKYFSKMPDVTEFMLHSLERRNTLQDGPQLAFTNRKRFNVSEWKETIYPWTLSSNPWFHWCVCVCVWCPSISLIKIYTFHGLQLQASWSQYLV